MKTLIMGIGNILRADDGVGSAVIEALEAYKLPENIDLLDAGTPGFELVLMMQDYQRVIVIDAADMGIQAGEWRLFSPEQIKQESRDMYLRGTLHYAGLAEALSLGDAMNLLPDTIEIIGIQPETIDWERGLTASVTDAVIGVCQQILAMLNVGIEQVS